MLISTINKVNPIQAAQVDPASHAADTEQDIIDVDTFDMKSDTCQKAQALTTSGCKGYKLTFPQEKSLFISYPFSLHENICHTSMESTVRSFRWNDSFFTELYKAACWRYWILSAM